MPQIETRTRTQIAEFLPNAIDTALTSYQLFSEQNISEEAKGFKAHHDACKVAIAHIELLIKLAQWADLPNPSVESIEDQKLLKTLIENGQKELGGYNGDE